LTIAALAPSLSLSLRRTRTAAALALILLLTISTFAGAKPVEVADLSDEILRAFESDEYEKASAMLRELRLLHPESPLVADLEHTRARHCPATFEAIRLFRVFTEQHPDHPKTPSALIELSQLYRISGDSTSSLREARRARDKYPSSPEAIDARLLIGRLNMNAGRWAAAAEEYATIIHSHPDHPKTPHAAIGMANAMHQLGKQSEAKALFKQYLQKPSPGIDAAHAIYMLGKIAQSANNNSRAVRYYRIVKDKLPMNFYGRAAGNSLISLGMNNPETTSPDWNLEVPPEGPIEEYAVSIGRFDHERAAAEAAVFLKAGFSTKIKGAPGALSEVLIGSFPTEIQARFFAEELEKKYLRPIGVIQVEPSD
jgi:tetratricopeptide (TPR) repeat protein